MLGPDGRPLAGALAYGQLAHTGWGHDELPAGFTVYALEAGRERMLLLQHAGKYLAARRDLRGDERGPVEVALRPAAAVPGRLVGDGGRPLAHTEITVLFRFRPDPGAPLHTHSREFRTDAAGSFRIDGLLPGMAYSAGALPPDAAYRRPLFGELTLKGGETKDLGDVRPGKRDGE